MSSFFSAEIYSGVKVILASDADLLFLGKNILEKPKTSIE